MTSVLDLGKQPWCNDLLDNVDQEEKVYPLHLIHCNQCSLLQLDHTVSKEVMFKEHGYRSGMTQTLIDHFYTIAKETTDNFLNANDVVLDIGGNDGSQMIQYQKLGIKNVFNVESATNIAKISKEAGVPTINSYFNESTAREHFEQGSVKLINAAGVFFHLEELHSVIKGVNYLLSEDGVFNIQCMYAGEMIKQKTFDMIYHEHLCYYTLKSLRNLLGIHGLEIFDAYHSPIHSGSLIVRACKGNAYEKSERLSKVEEEDANYTIEEFLKFSEHIKDSQGTLSSFLRNLVNEGKTIYAYGSPAKGNTLINFEGLNQEVIQKAVEINDLKVNKILPVSRIPIEKESKEDYPDYYLLLSHNFKDEILRKNKDLLDKGVKFIIPFPEIEVVSV